MDYRFRNSLGYNLNKVTNAIRFQFNKLLKSLNITGEQFAIMKIVDDNGRLTQIQIAKMISKDKTTVARAIYLLEKKGCIGKVRNKNDKRAYIVELNEKGRHILSKSLPFVMEYESIVRSRVSDSEIKAFFNVLYIMLDASEEMFQNEEKS